mmetsp:Transcript_14364/g.36090  ORF Transcript_14364/g.36090 Transcript_14364/m.36090 type:complete len:513 (+) Transcript_14364:182-1720(+)|eukprot:CAMPEP_0116095598 /NCGR_PEP_ID=MMETSP0327-20121206/9749_1 /TAXON_ID=44447 /ORGANISM="Pseudo-nitzschia delicatissima, Strain B596" /LENGTH=512 /DNA_ID=CAMNT_0003587277 /DNA_START=133 /DNA_END=1671 /DNA_ORIENTATION=-
MSSDTDERCPQHNLSIGPPASSPEDANDSGLMDDNDLSTGLLADEAGNINISSDDTDAGSEVSRRYSRLRLLMRRIGGHVASVTLLTMLLIIPVVIYRALEDKKVQVAAWHSAGVMVIGTLILSARLVYLHLSHWYMPGVQRYVVRILLMVPIYSVQSWLSLRFIHARIYIDAIRDFYEAFVIASFVYYLIELLGGEDGMARILRRKARDDPALAHHIGNHAFPLNQVLPPWELGVEFMLQCKHGVLQYVVAKALFTLLTYIFQSLGMYGEGEFVWTSPYPYLAFLMNISVMYALYCLVKLFHAVQDELRYPINWHPLGKFLCVKGVVFFTWWQGVLIFYLKAHGIIDDVGTWTGDEVANGLIDYCICVEMVGFAIAHSFTFTYKEYLPSRVESVMGGYEQALQQQQASADNNDENPEGNHPPPDAVRRTSSETYHPPEMLERPMRFKDAFWSSTVPTETLNDIRRLQNGVNHAASQVVDGGAISLQNVTNSSENEQGRDQPEEHDDEEEEA